MNLIRLESFFEVILSLITRFCDLIRRFCDLIRKICDRNHRFFWSGGRRPMIRRIFFRFSQIFHRFFTDFWNLITRMYLCSFRMYLCSFRMYLWSFFHRFRLWRTWLSLIRWSLPEILPDQNMQKHPKHAKKNFLTVFGIDRWWWSRMYLSLSLATETSYRSLDHRDL